MIPRVPRLFPESIARQSPEHELTGRAVDRRWCRHCVTSRELPEIGIDYGFFGRGEEDVLSVLCVECRNSSTRGTQSTSTGGASCASTAVCGPAGEDTDTRVTEGEPLTAPIRKLFVTEALVQKYEPTLGCE